MRRAQRQTKVAGAVPESKLHDHLAKQVEEKRLQKLEAELQEARAVYKDLVSQHDQGDFEAFGLAEKKHKEIQYLQEQLSHKAQDIIPQKTVVQLGPQESNPEGAPRAYYCIYFGTCHVFS